MQKRRSTPPKQCAIEHIASGNYCLMQPGSIPDHRTQEYTIFESRKSAQKALAKLIPLLPARQYAGEQILYSVRIL